MALTKVGIIYSLSQLVRRSVIIATIDDSEYQYVRLLDGEGFMYIPIETFELNTENDYSGAIALNQYIAAQIGQPSSDRHIVVDGSTGIIIDSVHADPRVQADNDAVNGWLIQDDFAVSGWTYDFVNAVAIPPVTP